MILVGGARPGDRRAARPLGTASRHEELDRSLALVEPGLTRARYVAFLRGSLAALEGIEPAVAPWCWRPDVRRCACLRRDLEELGAEPAGPAGPAGPSGSACLPEPAPLGELAATDPAGCPDLLGCAYVIEGSTLGGLVLAERVERALATRATSYLRLRGADNTRALTELVDDLLDVSRMVSGKLALDLDTVDLVALVESVTDSFAVAAEAKQLRIKRMLDSSATPVLGDETRLRQVVTNLLANAVKFTSKGGSVTVTLTPARARPSGCGGRLPAVALTAYGRAHDRTSVLAAGFSAHVRKPVDAAELVAVVASVSGRNGSR